MGLWLSLNSDGRVVAFAGVGEATGEGGPGSVSIPDPVPGAAIYGLVLCAFGVLLGRDGHIEEPDGRRCPDNSWSIPYTLSGDRWPL